MPSSDLVAAPPASRRRGLLVGTLLLAAAAVYGAWQLAFLCDDAYIAFRYVANAKDGNGLVWNVAPFAPVEGYTCFLWVVLLWATWSLFGVAPPEAAHALSIGFGLCLLVVAAAAMARIRDRDGRPLSTLAVLLGLAFVATNRTFLTWWTSGLETALFNVMFVGWVVLAFRRPARRGGGWIALWSLAAVGAALTRPDGLLLVSATAAAVALEVLLRRHAFAVAAAGLTPLLAVSAHVGWRRWFYGEWLPNTYYAKVTTPWPEAGARFLACFAVEHGAWLWPPIALLWLVVELARGPARAWRALLDHLPAVAAVGAVLFHVGYYVVRVGGDPFEYRVFSHLVPLGGIAVLGVGARLRRGSAAAIGLSLAVGLASLLGWGHYCYQKPTLTPFYQSIAADVPAPFRGLARWHDRQQAWLHIQVLCGRPQVHTMFLERLRAELPARSRMEVDRSDLPIAAYKGVGLPGWVLADVAILDLLGLNDWVAARTPVEQRAEPLMPEPLLALLLERGDADGDGRYTGDELRATLRSVPGLGGKHVDGLVGFLLLQLAEGDPDVLTRAEMERIGPLFDGMRFMAHERLAPAGYVDALNPNVEVVAGEVVVERRSTPLTAERVREIEAEWRRRTRERAR